MLPTGLNSLRFYTDEDLNTLKGDSEVAIGAAHSKLRLASRKNDGTAEIKIVCKTHRNNGCPFELVFQQTAPNQFMLQSSCLDHLQNCYFDPETLAFFDSRNRLIKLKPWITEFVRQHDANNRQQKPIKLLELMNIELTGGKYNIIEVGVKAADSKTKLKKKFDNIVNEIRATLKRKRAQTDQSNDSAIKADQLPENIYPVKTYQSPFKPVRVETLHTTAKTINKGFEALKIQMQSLDSTPELKADLMKLEVSSSDFTPLKVINTPIKQNSHLKNIFDPSPNNIHSAFSFTG